MSWSVSINGYGGDKAAIRDAVGKAIKAAEDAGAEVRYAYFGGGGGWRAFR